MIIFLQANSLNITFLHMKRIQGLNFSTQKSPKINFTKRIVINGENFYEKSYQI